MAHYALLNDDNVVTFVFPGKNENEDNVDWEGYYGNFYGCKCLRTSYNTIGNKHLLGGTPFRLNFAGVGMTYDPELNGFIYPKPDDSEGNFVLNKNTGLWNKVKS